MVDTHATVEQETQRWALLIGINDYPKLAPKYQLTGCLNDVNAIEELLTGEQFCFPRQNVLKLISPADSATTLPTRKNIIRAFQTHLVENEGIKAGDIIVIYYSGHGSYIPDLHQDEEDGYDETLVPCDSGPDRSNPDQVRDISDDELALMLDKLAERTQNINLFFDSCHSGTITRDLQDAEAEHAQGQARWLPPATCAVPTQIGLPVQRGTRSIGPGGWLPLSDGYVVISACHATERAREDNFWVSFMPPKLKRHGVLTHFLLKALEDVGLETTYFDIWDQVRAAVTRKNRWQNPQLEGAFERRVFGGAVSPRKRYFEVTGKDENTVILSTGLVQGATLGSRFAIYPVGTQIFQNHAARVAIVKLDEVDAFTSSGIIERGDIKQVSLSAPVIEIEHNFGTMQMSVHVVGEDELLTAIRREIESSPLLTLVTTAEQPSTATVRLGYPLWPDGSPNLDTGEKFHILSSGDGHPLLEPILPDADSPMGVRAKLEHIAKYYNILAIHNPDGQSKLTGQVKLHLFKVVGQNEKGDDLLEPMERNAGGDIVLRVGDRVVIMVENLSEQSLHLAVFDCDTAWGVQLIFPKSGATDDLIQPGHSRRTIRYKTNLPAHQKPMRANHPLPRETIKVIATTERVDFRSLWLPGVRNLNEIEGGQSNLYHLMKLATGGSIEPATRSLETDPVVRDWTTDELVFHFTA